MIGTADRADAGSWVFPHHGLQPDGPEFWEDRTPWKIRIPGIRTDTRTVNFGTNGIVDCVTRIWIGCGTRLMVVA